MKKTIKQIFDLFNKKYCKIFFGSDDLNIRKFNYFQIKRLGYKLKARSLSIPEINWERKSNKLYILASGESIANVTDSEWSEIEKHDVFGVNWSVVHDFPVDISFWEIISSKEINAFYLDRVGSKLLSNSHVCVNLNHAMTCNYFESFILPKLKNRGNFSCYSPVLLNLSDPSKESFSRLYNQVKRKIKKTPIHHCTHIGAVIDFGVKCGYSEIVIIGCDLNGGKYFSEVETSSQKYPGTSCYVKYNVLREEELNLTNKNFGNIHPSVHKKLSNDNGSITALEYFDIMSDLYENVDIKIYNKSSALSKYYSYIKEC